jgi:hypothetical protein
VPPPSAYATLTLKGTNLGSSRLGPWIFLNSSVHYSCIILSKYGYIIKYA